MPIAPNQMTHLSPKAALSAFTKAMIKKIKKTPPRRLETHFRSQWIIGKNYRPATSEEKAICPF